ncbi:MAG: hypothetical protein JNL10_19215 [Verrucomicrobiales bacterium]|nr:hypothetical protein [Verrucomicrobiales bacterium]
MNESRGWTTMTAVGVALLVGIVVVFLAMGRRPGDADQRLARWRSAGFPTTPAEVNAWYALVPASENLAPGVLDAMMAIRSNPRDTNMPTVGRGTNPPSGQPFSREQLRMVREFHVSNAASVDAMLKALERPRCRFPTDFSKGYMTLLPHLAPLKSAGNVLALEARLAADEGRGHDALVLLTNGLRLAAEVEAEPTTISGLVGNAIRNAQALAAEQVLGQGALDARDLATLQDSFLAAVATTTMTPSIVGEAANYSSVFYTPWRTLVALGGGSTGSGSGDFLEESAMGLYYASGLKNRDRRLGIRYFDDMLAMSQAPVDDRAHLSRKASQELDTALSRGFFPIAKMLLPALVNLGEKHIRSVSLLRAAAAACAVERFRLAHGGALPESLEALVPGLLPAVPLDPWTRQPLHYRRNSPGYVIYSVGTDGKDNNGVTYANRPKAYQGGYDDAFTVGR